MRTIILAAAFAVTAIGGANAQQWCGYVATAKSIIQCGYSSNTECENATGKGGMCFVDPEVALNTSTSPQPRRTHARGQLATIDSR